MGTSVNQSSPRTTNWTAVAAGYMHEQISPERVVTEVWRAAQSEPGFVEMLSSPTLFNCYKALKTATTMDGAMDALMGSIHRDRNNTIVAEFAKRALPLAYGTSAPPHLSWRSSLFSQLTDYFVSRDAPGYVGPSARFSNITELSAFKRTLRQHVASIVSGISADPKTPKQWGDFIRATLKKVGS